MPILGTISEHSGNYSFGADEKFGSRYQAGDTFTAIRMGAYWGTGFGVGEKARLAIYSDSAGSPNALLGYTAEITGDGNAGWKDALLDSSVAITSGTWYWLAAIHDSAAGIDVESVAGKGEEISDTYSDGFSDPYGSSTTKDFEVTIFATDENPTEIGAGGLASGGAVVETSGGTKYAVFLDSGVLEVWKDTDGTPSMEDSDTAATAFGGGAFGRIHAGIDGNDDIWIVAICTTEQTRVVASCIFDTGTDTLGGWTSVLADFNESVPTNPSCAITIDGSDYGRVLFTDTYKVHGVQFDIAYYSEWTGAAWDTPEQASASGLDTKWYQMTVDGSDNVHCVWHRTTGGGNDVVSYRLRTESGDSWGTEDPGPATEHANDGVAMVWDGSNPIIYSSDIDGDILEGTDPDTRTDTTYNTYDAEVQGMLAPTLDTTDDYLFFINTDQDVQLLSRTNGGWTNEGVLQTGTFNYVIALWSYNNNNQSNELNYIFDDGTNVYHGVYTLGVAPTTLTPTPATIPLVVPNPTVSLGVLTLTPTAVTIPLVVPNPSLVLTLALTPTPATIPIVVADPTIGLGVLTLTPTAAVIPIIAPSPIVVIDQFLTPTPAVIPIVAADPTVVLGVLTITPTPAVVPIVAADPTVVLTLTLTPTAAVIPLVVPDPTVLIAQFLTPTPATIPLVVPDPTVALTLSLTPTPATIPILAADPTLVLTLALSPTPATIPIVAADPTIGLGVLTLTPTPATIPIVAADPIISLVLTLTPTPATIPLVVADPTVVLGVLTLTPTPAIIPLVVPSPTVISGIILTPTPAIIPIIVPSPTISLGVLTIFPTPALIPIIAPSPTLEIVLTLSPTPALIPIIAPSPTLILALVITPTPVIIPIIVVDPTIILVGLPITLLPTPATIPILAPAPTISLTLNILPAPATIPLLAPAPSLVLTYQLSPDPLVIQLVIVDPAILVGLIPDVLDLRSRSFVLSLRERDFEVELTPRNFVIDLEDR
jgi:hypothetical protein